MAELNKVDSDMDIDLQSDLLHTPVSGPMQGGLGELPMNGQAQGGDTGNGDVVLGPKEEEKGEGGKEVEMKDVNSRRPSVEDFDLMTTLG